MKNSIKVLKEHKEELFITDLFTDIPFGIFKVAFDEANTLNVNDVMKLENGTIIQAKVNNSSNSTKRFIVIDKGYLLPLYELQPMNENDDEDLDYEYDVYSHHIHLYQYEYANCLDKEMGILCEKIYELKNSDKTLFNVVGKLTEDDENLQVVDKWLVKRVGKGS